MDDAPKPIGLDSTGYEVLTKAVLALLSEYGELVGREIYFEDISQSGIAFSADDGALIMSETPDILGGYTQTCQYPFYVVYLDKDELEQNIEFCDNLQGQKSSILSDITIYQKKIAEYSKGIRELYMDKIKGIISESDYVEMSKNFTAERDHLECVVADREKRLSEIDAKIAAGDNRRELIEQYTNLKYLTREIVETLIDYISVGKRIPGTKDVPIEIHWNF